MADMDRRTIRLKGVNGKTLERATGRVLAQGDTRVGSEGAWAWGRTS